MSKPIQVVVIIVCLVGAGILLWRNLAPTVPNGHIPEDFPNPWIAKADEGHPERIVVIPGRTEPAAPVKQDGVELWPAYRCLDPACPGRVGALPFLFAGVHGQICPKHPNRIDPTKVERWYTEEGEAILVRIRAEFAP